MSGKSKKTTADRTVKNQYENNHITFSASKITNRLSLSFYGQDTLKQRKQIILDTYEEANAALTPQK